MDVELRPARLEDLPAMHEVFLSAVNELRARTGEAPPTTPAADRAAIRAHVLQTDPDGYWVAEQPGGRLAGWASSIRRGRLWFLSGLWVRPDGQSRGLGRRLLALSLQTAPADVEGGVRCVYASRDHRALSLYQRAAMFPGWPFFTWQGPAAPAGSGLTTLGAAGLHVERLAPGADFTPAQAAAVLALDRGVRGPDTDRLDDHRFFRRTGVFTGYLFADRAGTPAAYANLAAWGAIAPLIARDPAVQVPVLDFLLAEAAAQHLTTVSLDVPGANTVLTAALLARRFQLVHYAFFLTSRPFGQFDRYAITGAVLL